MAPGVFCAHAANYRNPRRCNEDRPGYRRNMRLCVGGFERCRTIRVRGDEMLQHQFKAFDIRLMSPGSGFFDIFQDDFAYVRYTILGVNQVFPEFGGYDFRYMLMLGDRLDLLFGQFAYTDTVL